MSERLQKQTERYGIKMADHQEVAHLLTIGQGPTKRIVGVVTIDKKADTKTGFGLNVFLGRNIVLAAGGPGELYKTSVYPKGQIGIHGLAFKAGLVGANLTESQFGLASIKFRWNVSGTYMQALPRIFSTAPDGTSDEKEFLTDFFPSMSKMATDIFLKGYQWPFDPQRIEQHQSSLVDVLVFNETQKGRRVFMDFRNNPVGSDAMEPFDIEKLEPEAFDYLDKAGAMQATPIERLLHMNPPAIDIYKENGIDLITEPLEIAVCAQHNNGGFAIDRWWQSNIPHTFIIGEMAGSHGVKRPGGSALNAGQTGGLRAAEYIANVYDAEVPDYADSRAEIEKQLARLVTRCDRWAGASEPDPRAVIESIQSRMTKSGGHIRELNDVRSALDEAIRQYRDIAEKGLKAASMRELVTAVQAEHLALAGIGYLKAILELLKQGSGSRGSHLVLSPDGVEVHPDVLDKATGKPLRFKPENQALRNAILEVQFDLDADDLFGCKDVPLRPVPTDRKAFEPAWRDYREGKIYSS